MICSKCTHESYCDMAQFGGHNPPITACSKFKKKLQTNADRIRAMKDEELAGWLSDMHDTVTCPNYGDYDCIPSCRICWLDWLQTKRGEANDGIY